MALDENSKTFFNEVVNKGKRRKFIMMVKGQDILDMKVFKRGVVETYKSNIKSERRDKGLPVGSNFVHGVISGKKKDLNFQISREDKFDKAPVTSKKLRTFVRGATDSKIMFEPIFEIVDNHQLNIDPDDSKVAAEFLDLQEDAFNACDNFPDAAETIGALCLEIGKLLNKGEDEADKAAGIKVKELKQLLEKVIAGEYVGEEDTESSSEPELSDEEKFKINFEKITEKAQDCIRKKIGDADKIQETLEEIQNLVDVDPDYPEALSLIGNLEKTLTIFIRLYELEVKCNRVKKKLSDTLSESISKDYEGTKLTVESSISAGNYKIAESNIESFDQKLNDVKFKAEFEEVFKEAKKKLGNKSDETIDTNRVRFMLERIFTIGAKEGNYAKAYPMLKEFKEELEGGPIVTEFNKLKARFNNLKERIEKLSNLHVDLKQNLNEQCITISELMSKKDEKAIEIATPKVEKLKQHLDDIIDKKKAKEFTKSFKVAYEIAKEKLSRDIGDTSKIRMVLNYIVKVGVNNKDYTEGLAAVKRLEEVMGDAPVAGEFIELKPIADKWAREHPTFKGRIDDKYNEISKLVEESEYKKAGAKIKQFKQYLSDITDTKKEKKYEASFDKVFSIAAKYLKKDPTRAAIIDPIVDECNELAEYKDYTEALKAIKRLEEAMGTLPVVGEFIELKNEVDESSEKHPELKDRMNEKYQEIGDLISGGQDKKARAKIQQFKQYLSDITDTEKEEEYNTAYKTVSSEAKRLLKKDLGDSAINPLFVKSELKKCADLATKHKDYTAAIQALKELQSWLEVMAKDKAEVLPLIKECILNVETLREESPIESVMSIVSQSEAIIRKFDRHGSIAVSETIETLKEKLGTVKELMADILAVSKFDGLKDEVDRLNKMYPELESRIRGRYQEISDLIDRRKYKDAGAKVKLLKQYLSDITDPKKAKEYKTTYKTVSLAAQKLLQRDLGDSRVNPVFVNTELEKCAELAKERNYSDAIRALEELQSQLRVMATNKDKVLRFINECIQDIEKLGKKSSIGLVMSVINSSEEIIRKFERHGSVEVTEKMETLKEKLVDAKNLRDKKIEKRVGKLSKDIKTSLFGDEDTEAFEEFARKVGDDTLDDLYDEFGGQKGLIAVKEIHDGLSQKPQDRDDTSTSSGSSVDTVGMGLEFLSGLLRALSSGSAASARVGVGVGRGIASGMGSFVGSFF